MHLEQLPLLLGALVGLLGLWLLWDAVVADAERPMRRERRRSPRADRDRLGEGVLGVGALCLAAALIGRDDWRFGNVAVIAGAVLLVAGAALNLRFLRELLMNRGPARRQDERAPRGPEADRYVYGAAMGASESREKSGESRASSAATPADASPPPDAGDRPGRR